MRVVSGPELDTLHAPTAYPVRQLARAVEVTLQATETLGQRRGYVCGELGDVIGVYGDRGVFVLAEPPARSAA